MKNQAPASIELIAKRLEDVLELIDEANLGTCGAHIQRALDLLMEAPDSPDSND